jgi:hypothetical protein
MTRSDSKKFEILLKKYVEEVIKENVTKLKAMAIANPTSVIDTLSSELKSAHGDVEQVADAEEVSPRTIYNLIDDLKLAGVQDKAQKDVQDKEERKKNQEQKKEKAG